MANGGSMWNSKSERQKGEFVKTGLFEDCFISLFSWYWFHFTFLHVEEGNEKINKQRAALLSNKSPEL